jgi:hypothetical protein
VPPSKGRHGGETKKGSHVIDIKPKVRTASDSMRSGRIPTTMDTATTSVVVRPELPFDSVKVFAATKFSDRAVLGEVMTDWIAQHPDYRITEIAVRQSSDSEFHCLTMIVFYRAGE